MPNIRQPISFRTLIHECQRIEVPLIQRDYAQGRESEKLVRDDFLAALNEALSLSVGDPQLPLNLDFIYGTLENENGPRFLPLDGQQRLTTLCLLHWYLAWHDGALADFKAILADGSHSRFSYGVRPSSTEFFDELVEFSPSHEPGDVSSIKRLIEDQSWFFLYWRLDPTIQGVLTMLDAIHHRFRGSGGFYARLVDEERPSITFHLLPLEHFGLSDDLYIKMNARGKPLTAFETFKARFEDVLKSLFPSGTRRIGNSELPIPVFFERRMDTQWTNFFWSQGRATFDDAVLNLIWAIARVSLDPASPTFVADTADLGAKWLRAGFTLFHDRNWLTARFADHLMDLLEAWSPGPGLSRQLPNANYFDEAAIFARAVATPWELTYLQLVQLAAFVAYLTRYRGAVRKDELHQWMRIVRNLAANSDIERPEEYGRSLSGISEMVPDGSRILERFADGEFELAGFSPQQVREEVLKARLILADDSWQQLIEEAESHAYFSGQIGFILDFCGATEAAETLPANWTTTIHASLQASFQHYLLRTQLTFAATGLRKGKQAPERHLWKRALLSIGDYLPSYSGNNSFLTDPQRNWDSWKRFLRGITSGKRDFLKILWDSIDASAPIEPQLEQIIEAATGLEPWRAAIVQHPEVVDYCGQQEIRQWRGERIYLLSKRQLSGYHAELFTYVLDLELRGGLAAQLVPFELERYQDVYQAWSEPHVLLTYDRLGAHLRVAVESANGQFRILASWRDDVSLPDVESALCGEAGLDKMDSGLTRTLPREEIYPVLQLMAKSVRPLSA